MPPSGFVNVEELPRSNRATILFASHDMREVEMLCDRVLIMNKGSLIDQGSPGELMEKHQRKSLEEVFLSVSEEK